MRHHHSSRAVIRSSVISALIVVSLFLFGGQIVSAEDAATPDSTDVQELVLDKESLTVSVSEHSAWIEIENSNGGLSYSSSDTSVVEIGEKNDYSCELKLIRPGTATITAADSEGKTATATVTVTDADWHIREATFSDDLSNEEGGIDIKTQDCELNLSAKSSNTKVVKASGEGTMVFLEYVAVGSATITVTDQYGRSETCKVTVTPPALAFEALPTKYDKYDDEAYIALYSRGSYNIIKSAASSNPKVATAEVARDDWNYIVVTPVGAGTTTITAKDQYGQTAAFTLTLTQKYIDEMNYLEDLEGSWFFSDSDYDVIYGYKKIYCRCDIDATIYTTINGKKYTAKVDQDGDYVFSNLPQLNAGKSITFYCQKKKAIAKSTITIEKRSGKATKVSIKDPTYTGRALTPALTIKYGSKTLKKDTDYTVKYSNNKKIGTGRATITFKGNFKGAKAVTFNIVPKGTTLSKISAGKGSLTARWKKQTTQTSGYQIQYNTSKSFKAGTKIISVKGNRNISKKIPNLKSGKTYYVRVRTFKKAGSKTYCSDWSAPKTVKVK